MIKCKLFIAVVLVAGSWACTPTATKTASQCFKGRLQIKGICNNYVITVLEGNTALLNLEKRWTDETDGTVYQNVFTLANKCGLPNMQEGEEFYFTLQQQASDDCVVCQAYRPVPNAKNAIQVTKEACL